MKQTLIDNFLITVGHAQAGHVQAGHAQAGHAQAGHAQAGHAKDVLVFFSRAREAMPSRLRPGISKHPKLIMNKIHYATKT